MTDNYKIPNLKDLTVVCIGSGPSLIPSDCSMVKLSGHYTIVTNTTFRLCPWADMLFAFDGAWWNQYIEEVKGVFKGDLVTYAPINPDPKIQTVKNQLDFLNFGSSGVNALSLAILAGAKKVVLLGFDCSLDFGYHWHGKHPIGLSNCASISKWPEQFKLASDYAKRMNVEVINASRVTAIKSIKRSELWNALK